MQTSPLVRGEWIEIWELVRMISRPEPSPLVRGEWIEILHSEAYEYCVSPLVRGEWIEILCQIIRLVQNVSPLVRGGVD